MQDVPGLTNEFKTPAIGQITSLDIARVVAIMVHHQRLQICHSEDQEYSMQRSTKFQGSPALAIILLLVAGHIFAPVVTMLLLQNFESGFMQAAFVPKVICSLNGIQCS